MIRVSELRLELDEDESLLRKKAGKVLRTDPKYIEKLTIFKKSVDARKKDDVHFSYTVDVTLGLDETQVLRRCRSPKAKAAEEYKYTLPVNRRQSAFRPVVVGFGPAGMFAGLILAEAGLRPIVLERGKDIQRRQQDVNAFWQQHILNEESNVQFGEGGAGTFSDGKLTTGIKSPLFDRCCKSYTRPVRRRRFYTPPSPISARTDWLWWCRIFAKKLSAWGARCAWNVGWRI